MKVISCGIIILNDNHEMLACHITGNTRPTSWDIPKGHLDEKDLGATDEESYKNCAARELVEETGIQLSKDELDSLQYLGKFNFMPSKDLVLFKLIKNDVNPATCKCTSMFELYGRQRPEIDNFMLTKSTGVFTKALQNLFADLGVQSWLD